MEDAAGSEQSPCGAGSHISSSGTDYSTSSVLRQPLLPGEPGVAQGAHEHTYGKDEHAVHDSFHHALLLTSSTSMTMQTMRLMSQAFHSWSAGVELNSQTMSHRAVISVPSVRYRQSAPRAISTSSAKAMPSKTVQAISQSSLFVSSIGTTLAPRLLAVNSWYENSPTFCFQVRASFHEVVVAEVQREVVLLRSS